MIRAPLLLCGLLLMAWALPAPGQVRRCVDARGVAVYTDRPCESMQAAPRQAPPDASTGATLEPGFAVRGCARRPETLLNGVRTALEARDVNRLANWYHWTGTGSGAARSLMDELEAIAQRPLVSVELVYPGGFSTVTPFPDTSPALGPTGPSAPPGDPAAGPAADSGRAWDLGRAQLPSPTQAQDAAPETAADPGGPTANGPALAVGDAAATPAVPSAPPESLLVQQMRGAADIQSVTVRFALRENAGCWWIEL